MNAFFEHHQDSIRFDYRCFDRLLLNGLIQPFQQPERVIGFFNFYRQQYPVSRDVLRDIAAQFQNWVVNRSQKWDAPILEAPEGRRDDFIDPYFRQAKPDDGRRHRQRPRTGAHHDRDREQERRPLASADRAALGHAVQLLRQRPALGPNVRAHVSLPSVLRARLPEPAPLAGQSHARRKASISSNAPMPFCSAPIRHDCRN